ncbi:MAG: DNA polymerase III subunit gamma/tau [Burkholderiales bacterium]|nr:DNA polymerase III subunit gamma/tau [Burkholderiales bacterium]
MSYQVLARKYRPKSFETLVGQEHVVRALSHALEQQRLHHAYLFTGTRGVGKTTLSRILAKSFNCETGITATPCGVCEACTAIDAGRFVDYIEMDAASNRGVDEMASLLEQAIYAPSNARFKVYMIDEVHMLTNHAFNAMLKTLEEPPEHVKFILATTDPQKIPVTVLSRCLQFNLKQMPPGHIIAHLENILGQEQIEFDVPALRLLAQGAHGSMRDALSLTDQAIAYAAGKVSLDAVQGMLGALDQSYLFRLLDGLVASDGAILLDVADEMAARSLSYKAALQDLGTLLHQIAIAQLVPSAVAEDLPEREQVLRLAQCFTKEDIQLYYQIAVHGRNELALAPDEYAGFSMTLLRMLAFRPTESGQTSTASHPSQAPRSGAPAAPARPARTSAPEAVISASTTSKALPPTPTKPAQATAVATDAPPVAVTTATATGQRLSPAMAALAAARAGSGKQAATPSRPAPSASTAPITQTVPAVAATTVAPVSPATVPTPAAPVVPAPVPVSLPEPAPANSVESIAAAQPANAMPRSIPRFEMESEPMGMDDMPPPWDDDVLMLSTPATNQQTISSAPSVVTRNEKAAAPAKMAAEMVDFQAPIPEPAQAEQDRTVSTQAVPELDWDGNWPALAAGLPVRGVAQQLAQQSELILCRRDGNAFVFELRVPLATLLSAGSVDKLSGALAERFSRAVRIETKIGAVELTANAQAIAEREARQKQAEQSIQNDSFIQTLMRDFGASIITGSIKPV